MNCKYCGNEIVPGQGFCSNCGAKVEEGNPQPNNPQNNYQYVVNPSQPNPNNNRAKSGGEASGLGIASMIFGIMAILFMCIGWLGFILGLVAIILACVDKKRNGFRTAGLVTGIIGLLIGLVMIAFSIINMGVLGALIGAANEYDKENLNKYSNDYTFDYGTETTPTVEPTSTPAPTTSVSASSNTWGVMEDKDGYYVYSYLKGMPDNFKMSEKGTFKDLTDWLEYAVPGYPKEMLRSVLSAYFCNEDYYNTTMSKYTADERNYILALFTSLAWQLDHDSYGSGKLESIQMDPNDLDVIEFHLSSSSSYSILQWNTVDNGLKMGTSRDNLKDYITTTFDKTNLAAYMVAIENALNGVAGGN
jgi:hypothetical protein